ncbi:hypothetical protein TNCV_1162071 [Trichonephila clavipes]|nr:hypothetical protein TNCV_1162071 [Trichonephila clavipes]
MAYVKKTHELQSTDDSVYNVPIYRDMDDCDRAGKERVGEARREAVERCVTCGWPLFYRNGSQGVSAQEMLILRSLESRRHMEML